MASHFDAAGARAPASFTKQDTVSSGAYGQSASPLYEESPSSDHTANGGEAGHGTQDQDDTKRPRACEGCRGLKVRCIQDPANPDAPCRRCAKAGRQCVYTQPSRKRQKKADTRVADLEKKLDALTAALQAQQYAQGGVPMIGQAPAHPQSQSHSPNDQRSSITRHPEASDSPARAREFSHPGSAGVEQQAQAARSSANSPHYPDNPNKRRKTDTSVSQKAAEEPFPNVKVPFAANPIKEPGGLSEGNMFPHELFPLTRERQTALVRSLVDPALRDKIFDRYMNDCMPNLPAVVLPPGTTALELVETKPILTLAILSCAGFGLLPAGKSGELFMLMCDVISEIAIRQGSASLELVQAMIVIVFWVKAPERPERSGFYLLVHLAATMAIDLGMGKRFNPSRARKGFGMPGSAPQGGENFVKFGVAQVDSDSIEARRTWLACYYCGAAASMSLRRPNLIRWTSYMQECVEVLESSPAASKYDALFCQYVRLQNICEEISVAFQMDDPSATAISISDPKVSYQLDVYEKKFEHWKHNLAPEFAQNKKLMFFYDVGILYLNEIALHVNHNVDDFQLPFSEDALKSNSQHSEILTQRQMKSLEACLSAAHSTITTYCSFGVDVISTTPTLFYFVRCMYALVVLIKMHLAVQAPNSEVAKIIKADDVRVFEMMEMIWTLFQEMTRHPTSKPPPKALKILGMLREWIQKHSKSGEPLAPKEARQQGAHKGRPFGRNLHGVAAGSSKLQVLSEAATAGQSGATPQQAPHGRQGSQGSGSAGGYRDGQSTTQTSWTFDTPDPFSHHRNRGNVSSAASSVTTGTSPSMNSQGYFATPEAQHAQLAGKNQNGFYPDMFGAATGGSGAGNENYDWTAGMDLDQLLDGAFSHLDASGDLGGWFFGDGVGAYQLPTEGSAPTGGTMGDNGRWQ